MLSEDQRPDWAVGREKCPTCRRWHPLRKDGRIRKHMRQQKGRWHMVPCEGSGQLPQTATPKES